MFDNESEAQRQNREAIATENIQRAAELRERENSRREHAAAERAKIRNAEIQQQGSVALQTVKSARAYKADIEAKFKAASASLAAAEERLENLIADGFVDTVTPLVEKQDAEKKARETADAEKREAFKASLTSKPIQLTAEEIAANESAAKARAEYARMHRSCPQCRREVTLTATGELPEEHTYTRRDPQTSITETLTCFPYGIEPRSKSTIGNRIAEPFV